jgi:hypothetical protein
MANTRHFYANSALFIKPAADAGAYDFVRGIQSASDSFDLPAEFLSQWGMIGDYEAVDGTADVTFDCEKLIDGSVPLYLAATEGSSAASLTARSEKRSVIAVGVYPSDADYVTGTPTRVFEYSGMQPTNVSYTFNVDGPFTESMSFLGNYAEWQAAGAKYGTIPSNPTSSGTDVPPALTACSGGVQFKENLLYTGTYPTLLPTFISGITSSGTMPMSNSCPTVPIQSITVSVDLSREKIDQLGCKTPYARLAQFPVDVTTEIEVLSQSGHGLEVTERGSVAVGCEYTNAPVARIRVCTQSGLVIDLGSKNKLTGVTQTFGDTGGSNATYTLSFTNKSVMSVFHPNDPSSITYAGSP